MAAKLPMWDRFWFRLAPRWSLGRMQARHAAETFRHWDAASRGRRTAGWARQTGDVNATNGPALSDLRIHARDTVRNNGWAKKGLQIIMNNTVGTGIVPKPIDAGNRAKKVVRESWKKWARSKDCDFDGRLNFYGLQRQVSRSTAESGEVLVRRYRRANGTLQIRLLEADLLDTSKDTRKGTVYDTTNGFIVQGVEFDPQGRRVAYWLFDSHPGSISIASMRSHRVPAEDILHVFEMTRPGQVRGVSWFAAVLLTLKDFDEYEDATAMKAKIAALLTAFVVNSTTAGSPVLGPTSTTEPKITSLEPGQIVELHAGQDVKFSNPPSTSDHESFSRTQLRKGAAGLGLQYEEMTGDYSNVNYSSARMGRLAFQANVDDWRWNMIIPLFCDPVWNWFVETEIMAMRLNEAPAAEWTAPPLPALDPDKEALATIRRVRSGVITHDEMLREQGIDPDEHWDDYEAGVKKLKEKGIVLDTDASVTTQAGNPRDQAKPEDPAQAVVPPEAESELLGIKTRMGQ